VTGLAAEQAQAHGMPTPPRVVVTVGTDHHQFDRLIGWVNDWLGQHPEMAGGLFVQSGAASLTPACPGQRFLTAGQLDAELDAADVVVCHGGPGSIADAWSRGHLPIVVPRLRKYGEVVDDHQVDFCVKLAELGRVRLALTGADLSAFLDNAARGSLPRVARADDAAVEAAIGRFAALVDELVSRTPRQRRRLRWARRTSRLPGRDDGLAAVNGSPATGRVPPPPRPWRAFMPPTGSGPTTRPKEETE